MTNSLKRRLGANLRTYRHSKGLTQEALAERLGMSVRYLAGVERAEENLTLDSVDQLAKDLHIDALELLVGHHPDKPQGQ